MNERAFVDRRKSDWEHLEAILKRASMGLKTLSQQELNDVGRLYRRVAGDLAYVRTHGVSDELIDYLNDLVGRGYGLLYKAERKGVREGFVDFIYAMPEVVRRRSRFIYTATGFTLLGGFLGYLVSMFAPALIPALVPEGFQRALEGWKSGKVGTGGAPEMIAFTGQLWLNNTRVSLLCFGAGLSWGVLTVYMLIQNGLLLGLFAGEVAKTGKSVFFWSGVTPHGVTELSAIFMAAAGGLVMAKALIAPGDLTRFESLKRESGDAFTLAALAAVMLVFAAGIEAWFSHQPFSPAVKFGFALVSLAGWLAYWLGLRRPQPETNAPSSQSLEKVTSA